MARRPVLLPPDAISQKDGSLTKVWAEYLAELARGDAQSVKAVSGAVNLTAQAAAVSSTAIPIQTVYTALYRVSYYARITQAATTNSSLTVTVGWTESSVALSDSGAAITGNTTTTVQSGSFLLLTDGGSDITYSTAYSSTGATAMQYRLRLVVELVEN